MMEKTIIIDGKEVRLKTTGGTPKRYKAQFGKCMMADMLRFQAMMPAISALEKGEDADFSKLDFDTMYNLIWVYAKTADNSIADPLTWLDGFDEFPLYEIFPEVQEMLMKTVYSSKKK